MTLCASPKAQYDQHSEAIKKAIQRVLDSGWFIMGPEVKEFEKEFYNFIGSQFGVGVANGTDAITLCLKALGIGPGDEVITVSHTAVATVCAVDLTGAMPILVDIEKDYYTIDPSKIESAISKNTKAIIPVHIYGQSAELDSILNIAKKHNLFIIEDCAQAHGGKYNGKTLGSIGDLSAFSFYPTKNLGALGDGGFCISNHAHLNERLDILRQYGWKERYVSHIEGMNSRLDEIQAAILREKLKALSDDNNKRRQIANVYFKNLKDLPVKLPQVRPNTEHVFHLFAITTDNRDKLFEFLKTKDIFPLIHYPVPIHKQDAYLNRYKDISLPITEELSKRVLSLPMYPELDLNEVERICDEIRAFFK